MIYIFGDLRQLRSFELARPSISSPQRLRPLRNSPAPVRPPPPEPEPWSIPIRRPPIIPRPVHDLDKSSTTNTIRFLSPNPESVPSSLSLLNTGLRADNANPRVTLSSVCTDSFISCESDVSHTTTSSDEVEIHISEAFQDIEPPYIGDDLVASSPVPSSWRGESPSSTPTPWVPHLMGYTIDSVLPPSPASQKFPSPTDNLFLTSVSRTSTTLDREEEKEKWLPTATFIRPFEYTEWEERDSESGFCTTEGSLGGYGGGDEESRISHLIHPTRSSQDRPRSIGTEVPAQLRVGVRRGTTASSKGPEQLGSFDFDALPAFRVAGSGPAVTPFLQRKPRYRTCDASPPPPLVDETSLTGVSRQGGTLRTWFVEIPKAFIRRTQGKCGAAKGVIRDVLSRSAREAAKQNGDGDGEGNAYRDVPEMRQRFPSAGEAYQDRASNGLTINTVPRSLSNSHHTVSRAKEKGGPDAEQVKEGWRARWKRVSGVPAFKSPLTKILSPVVTRAQWEVVVRSGALAFVISIVVVAVLVAIPVPP